MIRNENSMSLMFNDSSKSQSYLRRLAVADFTSPGSLSNSFLLRILDSSFQFSFTSTSSGAFVVELDLDRMHSSSKSHVPLFGGLNNNIPHRFLYTSYMSQALFLINI